MTAIRQRRNEMAQEMGYRNTGGLLSAIERAAPEVRRQIAELLTIS